MISADNSFEVEGHVGVVLGTKPATPVEFWIAVERSYPLQLDDTVWTSTKIKINGIEEEVRFYGIVDLVEKSYEGLNFDSDMYHIRDIPVEERHVAHVKITRIEPEYFIPPQPNAPVFLARGEKFHKTIGADMMKRKVPAGLSLATQEVVYIDLDYIDGEKGAHVSISGISGVATKTSYGIFLLHEIMRLKAREGDKTFCALIFNVKGEDLLFLDKPNRKLFEIYKDSIELWAKISPEIKREFIDVRKGFSVFPVNFYAPPRKNTKDLKPDVSQRDESSVSVLAFNFFDFAKYGFLDFVISDEENENVKSLAYLISELLQTMAQKTEQKYKNLALEKKLNFVETEEVGKKDEDKKIKNIYDFIRYLERIFSGTPRDNFIRHEDIAKHFHPQTLQAFLRRLNNMKTFFGNIIREDVDGDVFERIVKIKPGTINVIHIGNLPEPAQRFVVGAILKTIFRDQEMEGSSKRKVIVFLDELSKYAPREGSSPIKDILEDIAERGRSLGVILIGAQQSASTVSKKIIMNSSIKIIGRMSPEEVEKSEYDFLSTEMKKRLITARPGRVIISQPEVFAPIPVLFPFPFWATKKDEVFEPRDTKSDIGNFSYVQEE
jgi:hypothetical protein